MSAKIAPSILAADFMNLGREIALMEEAGASILHVDVMDGHYVPNLSIGLPVLESIRRGTNLFLDVHLMISNPEELVDAFIKAGADSILVHYETVRHLDRLIESIKAEGALAGVVLNPHIPLVTLEDILPMCDLVLIMSVNPGFGGQEFISTSLEKVRKLRSLVKARDLSTRIEIDGGITASNTGDVVRAGVNVLVAGSAIFKASQPIEAFREMQQIAENASKADQTEANRSHV